MASTINATTNGIVNIGDSVATLALQTGGTTAVAIDTAQIVSLSKSLALLGSTSGSVTIAAPAVAGTQSYTLPTAVPASNGYALTSTTAGVMSWAASSGGTPGGSSTQVQYNSGGTTFGGISGFTTDGTRVTASTTIGVGGATPSTSGSGITFPATQSASTDVNTLDDYEEGTWTPSLGGTTTYTTQAGSYVKIGRLVYIFAYLNINAIGTGSTTVVSGLPFTPSNSSSRNPSGFINYFNGLATSVVALFVQPFNGSPQVNFPGLTAAAASVVNPITVFTSSTQLYFSAVYETTT